MERIAESDIYEALAFSEASKCNVVLLLAYPADPSNELDLGQAIPFEIIEVDKVCVIGVEVETKDISSVGGLLRFARRYSDDFQLIVHEITGITDE